MLVTMELEPTPERTILHQRMSAPETAEERAILEPLRPWLDEAIRASSAGLAAQLAALGEHEGDVPPEPGLPRPRPGGVLDPQPPA